MLFWLPGALIFGFWWITYQDVKEIMKREDPSFKGQVNNTFDLLRIIKTFRKSTTLSDRERNMLKLLLILEGILMIIFFLFLLILILMFS
jgi:hypothetical protein